MTPKVIFFDAINTVFDVSGRPREELAEYVRQFEAKPYRRMELPDAWMQLPMFPDAKEGIERISLSVGLQCGILSNVPRDIIGALLMHNGFGVDFIVPLELGEIYKPDPRAYVWAAGCRKVPVADCLMVTANPRIGHADHGDLEAAASMGMSGVLIRNPGSPQTIIELAEQLGC